MNKCKSPSAESSVWRVLQSAADSASTHTQTQVHDKGPFWQESSASLEMPENSASFLQAMFDALSSPIAILNQMGSIVAINEAWLQQHEDTLYYPTLGTNYLWFCEQNADEMPEMQPIAQGIGEVLSGQQERFQKEYVSHALDQRRWNRLQVNRFVMSGMAYGVLVHEDITQCKQVEEALQFSEEYFRALFEHASDVILVLNTGGTILYPSPSVEKVLGYPCSSLKHRSCFDWVHQEDVPTLLSDFAKLLQYPNEPLTVEFRCWHQYGEWRTLEGTAQNLLSHRAVGGIVLNLRDISERKLFEQQLQHSDAKNRAMVEAIPDLMFRFDQQGHVLDLNDGQLPTPSALQNLVHRKASYHVSSNHELITYAQQHAKEVLSTRQNAMFECHLNITHRLFVYEVRLSMCGEHEVLVMIRDITDQKRLQSKLLQADRMVELGTLAASMGHEINNPLTYVISGLEELRDVLQEPFLLSEQKQEELAEIANEAVEGAERVRLIARDLKTYAHTNAKVGPVDVHDVLNRILQLMANEIKHRTHLDKDFGTNIPRIHGNSGRLEQVFINLLLNALHALPEEKSPRNVIHIRTSYQPGGRVEVAFSDNGKGIPTHQLEHIFEPFFTTKSLNQGTGLGLFVCHNIINTLGGTLSVRSQVGEGTTFLLELQVAKEDRDASEQENEEQEPLELFYDNEDFPRDTLIHRIPDEILEFIVQTKNEEQQNEEQNEDTQNEVTVICKLQPGKDEHPEALTVEVKPPTIPLRPTEISTPAFQAKPPVPSKSEPTPRSESAPKPEPTPKSEPTPRSTPTSTSGLAQPRILVIDDEPRVARSLCRLLRDCETAPVYSAKEAMERCQEGTFDLIICDVMMPEITGIEFYKQLGEKHATLQGKFVFMTGGAFTEGSQSFLKETSCPVLEKPFERQQMQDILKQMLPPAM